MRLLFLFYVINLQGRLSPSEVRCDRSQKEKINNEQHTQADLEVAVGVDGGLLGKTTAVGLLTGCPQQV